MTEDFKAGSERGRTYAEFENAIVHKALTLPNIQRPPLEQGGLRRRPNPFPGPDPVVLHRVAAGLRRSAGISRLRGAESVGVERSGERSSVRRGGSGDGVCVREEVDIEISQLRGK
ncbi:hypothetical protein ACHAWF_005844 [Thalassiosira exigua]